MAGKTESGGRVRNSYGIDPEAADMAVNASGQGGLGSGSSGYIVVEDQMIGAMPQGLTVLAAAPVSTRAASPE